MQAWDVSASLVRFVILLGGAGALVVLLFLRGSQKEAVRWVTFLTMLAGFVISLKLFLGYDADSTQTMQFIESTSWLPEYGIVYKVGMDGMSLLLFMMTTFLGPLVILSSWRSIEEKDALSDSALPIRTIFDRLLFS